MQKATNDHHSFHMKEVWYISEGRRVSCCNFYLLGSELTLLFNVFGRFCCRVSPRIISVIVRRRWRRSSAVRTICTIPISWWGWFSISISATATATTARSFLVAVLCSRSSQTSGTINLHIGSSMATFFILLFWITFRYRSVWCWGCGGNLLDSFCWFIGSWGWCWRFCSARLVVIIIPIPFVGR